MKRKQSLNSDGQQFYQYSINKTNNPLSTAWVVLWLAWLPWVW